VAIFGLLLQSGPFQLPDKVAKSPSVRELRSARSTDPVFPSVVVKVATPQRVAQTVAVSVSQAPEPFSALAEMVAASVSQVVQATFQAFQARSR
jgi:hypothetical protein